MSQSEEFQKELSRFILDSVRKKLRATAGRNPDLSKVVVWLENYNPDTGMVVLGLALGTGTGCSPFCGCAANQIAEALEASFKNHFSWVKKVRGEAKMPGPRILEDWNKEDN